MCHILSQTHLIKFFCSCLRHCNQRNIFSTDQAFRDTAADFVLSFPLFYPQYFCNSSAYAARETVRNFSILIHSPNCSQSNAICPTISSLPASPVELHSTLPEIHLPLNSLHHCPAQFFRNFSCIFCLHTKFFP